MINIFASAMAGISTSLSGWPINHRRGDGVPDRAPDRVAAAAKRKKSRRRGGGDVQIRHSGAACPKVSWARRLKKWPLMPLFVVTGFLTLSI
jgi:hypothetical protein